MNNTIDTIKKLLRENAVSPQEAQVLSDQTPAEFEESFGIKQTPAKRGRTLLVTGGSGFIGTNFIHYILDKYPVYRVINLDLLTYAGNPDNHLEREDDPRYMFVRGDIGDENLVEQLLRKYEVDIIVNFAAESHVDRSIDNPSAFLNTNVFGTFSLLQAALKVNKTRFHHISTDEVYGSLDLDDKDIFHEGKQYDPRSPYSASKASSDHLVKSYHATYGLPITITNCSNNYGPYMYPEKLFPLFITNLLEGKKVPLYGDGTNVRDWLHVYDHCRAIDLVIHRGRIGETYCVGADNEKSNKEIADTILGLMGVGGEMIEFVQDRLGHDKRYAIDYSKIKNELGWQPTIGFRDGLRDMIKWYMENREWWRKLKSYNT